MEDKYSKGEGQGPLCNSNNTDGSASTQVSKEEYARVGSAVLCEQLQKQLEEAGRRPYVIPVGGSNAIGTWGYIAAVEEILSQAGKGAFSDIVMVRG